MRVLLQRVRQAHVSVDDAICGQIGAGVLLLVGIEDADTDTDLAWMASKVANLRIFEDEAGVMNLSLRETGGAALAVSQFTLFGSYRKGNRPSWGRAAKGEVSQPMFDAFVTQLSTTLGKPVPTGIFGAEMLVSLVNDGPVTLQLDSKQTE
ncbi:D-aminoacyl-tRNA deacylase [Jeongeupia sp. HS-3]|uniref:D-aminoacyl-tRNA deacylase n=1 Tax=Jeongeupia sp. HS-3 TaxID=1009682 RepID=UPI0018A49B50|nr:D-aminoacyl-tRNA deacylase [Jeongeupia sp. HS-3]BCL77230.1 D-aminoacyl-tRNA deacylase [Jeongeupia sp. HS-3]